MLEDEEFREAYRLYGEGMRNYAAGIKDHQERFKALLDYYVAVTGVVETAPNAVMHHHVEQYEATCENWLNSKTVF